MANCPPVECRLLDLLCSSRCAGLQGQMRLQSLRTNIGPELGCRRLRYCAARLGCIGVVTLDEGVDVNIVKIIATAKAQWVAHNATGALRMVAC